MATQAAVWRGHVSALREEIESLAGNLADLMERARRAGAAGPEVVTVQGWELDTAKRELRSPSGASIRLTAGEQRLLGMLLERPGYVVRREELMRRLYEGAGTHLQLRNMDAHVNRIRRKLGAEGVRIEAVRGVGYRWIQEESPCQ